MPGQYKLRKLRFARPLQAEEAEMPGHYRLRKLICQASHYKLICQATTS